LLHDVLINFDQANQTTTASKSEASTASASNLYGRAGSETTTVEETIIPINASTKPEDIVPPISRSYIFKQLLQDSYTTSAKSQVCYHPLRSLLYATPDKQLRLLLTRGLYELFPTVQLLVFFSCYVVFSVGTYYIALPTDLVVPNLILGSAGGRLVGQLVNYIRKGLGKPISDPGIYALLGMAGLWSGTSHLVISVTVITLEMTTDFDSFPAILIVTFVASQTSNLLRSIGFGESLIHTEMKLNGTPYMPNEPPHGLKTVSISAVATKHGLVTLSLDQATVEDCQKALDTKCNGFIVVAPAPGANANGNMDLNGGVGSNDSGADGANAVDGVTEVKHLHSSSYYYGNVRPVGFIQRDRLAEILEFIKFDNAGTLEPTKWVDLSLFSNISPCIFPRNATAAKVFRTMRTLGLRQVLIAHEDDGSLCGIVTRKDLLRAAEALKMHRKKKEKKEREAKRLESVKSGSLMSFGKRKGHTLNEDKGQLESVDTLNDQIGVDEGPASLNLEEADGNNGGNDTFVVTVDTNVSRS
jgi:chloride channel 7